MEQTALLDVQKLALKKLKLFRTSPLRFLSRSMLASMFIGFGVIVAFKTGNYFYLEHSPFAYPMAAFTFGAAIVLIVYGGGDLFTGNTFYFTFAALRGKVLWKDVLKIWALSYGGNIIGAICFSIFIYATGLFKDPSVNSFLLKVVEKKIHAPISELFFRGILCNWLVCQAFFIPMNLKGDSAKLITMILFVFCFFISGYEHSIANMCTFAIAIVSSTAGTYSISEILHNLIPVTIGNIIGGTILMGFMYYYVNKSFLEE
ncbi:formate/nitrite transporter family protein [Bacillus sp. 03113]|uniref:formate/nitrite transporter family protein n=1 Tax=Bacillus sp. 03113 TaxID=2578211 RepID=UPI0011451A27|nr:formate/nitrite transporter family protein [Bacillus sp. 03113]